MLISETIKIEVNSNNIKYHQRNNKNISVGDIVIRNISELSQNSGIKVDVKCDYCGVNFKMEYRKYLRSIKTIFKNSCNSNICVDLKTKEISLIKFGVENVMKLDFFKEKAKKSNLDKFGTENPNELDYIKKKIKEKNLEKFGTENPNELDYIKKKIKETNLKKFGTENPNELDYIKNKIKNTSLNKWGVSNYTKTEEYKIKSKETSLSKWGVSNYTKTEEYREKVKKSNFEKWGSEITSHSEEYRRLNYKIANHPNYIRFIIDEKLSEFKCDSGGDHKFKIGIDNFYHRTTYSNPLCTICYPVGNFRSIKEEELYKLVKSIYSGDIIQSYRDKYEIDIYIPEMRLGFEFNGLRWHSNEFLEKDYHLKKTNYFKEKGIRIIHIWEDDFDHKRDIIESQLKNFLKKTEEVIYARRCFVLEISSVSDFLEKNHIQGNCKSVLKLGLYSNDELISVMTFDHFEGRKKMKENEWCINRFCSKLNTKVVGGSSKLLKYFIEKYKPNRIISYADKDWSDGNLYETLNFKRVSESKPDYKYVIKGKRVHKSRFRKSLTKIRESKINLPRVYDCGKIKFEKILKY